MPYKKLLLYISIFTILFTGAVVFVPEVAAQSELLRQTEAFAGKSGADFGQARDPRLIVATSIRIILGVVGTLFTIYAIYGGVLIMTAAGNSDQVDQGKKVITSAIIAVILVLSAWSITLLVTRIARGDELADKDCVWVAEKGGFFAVGFTDVNRVDENSRFRNDPDNDAPRTIGKFVPCTPE